MIDDSNDENKMFIVTAKFKMSGILPGYVEKKHIEGNIQSAIEEAVGDIALSSEYYDMNDDIEWEIYLEGDVKVRSKEFSVVIREEPFCEHCGERHTDFGIEVYDDGTSWCMGCFLSGSDADDVFTKEELKELYKREKLERRSYLLKKLHELEANDEEDYEDDDD